MTPFCPVSNRQEHRVATLRLGSSGQADNLQSIPLQGVDKSTKCSWGGAVHPIAVCEESSIGGWDVMDKTMSGCGQVQSAGEIN